MTPTWLNPTVRRWLYGVTIAIVPLAVLYGLIEQESAALWVTLIGAITGVVALPNVPLSDEPASEVTMEVDGEEVAKVVRASSGRFAKDVDGNGIADEDEIDDLPKE